MTPKPLKKALDTLMSLGDPVRRRLYEAVAEADAPISRSDVAKATGVARPLAAYHLDRLETDGLLVTHFERQTGRAGPGAGRPEKLYSRPPTPVQVTLPPRDSDLAARLMVETLASSRDPATRAALNKRAREAGNEIARNEIARPGERQPDVV